jgi:hypothetical protein
MRKVFSLWEDDKWLEIRHSSPYEHLSLRIDYDDVDHSQVMKESKRLLALMNKNAEKLTK